MLGPVGITPEAPAIQTSGEVLKRMFTSTSLELELELENPPLDKQINATEASAVSQDTLDRPLTEPLCQSTEDQDMILKGTYELLRVAGVANARTVEELAGLEV